MNSDPIYTVTTLKDLTVLEGRTVGYFYDIEDAHDEVINNTFDIYEEGYYPYVVIEQVSQGFYNFNNREDWWFKWDESSKQYKKIEKPEEIKSVFGWGIG